MSLGDFGAPGVGMGLRRKRGKGDGVSGLVVRGLLPRHVEIYGLRWRVRVESRHEVLRRAYLRALADSVGRESEEYEVHSKEKVEAFVDWPRREIWVEANEKVSPEAVVSRFLHEVAHVIVQMSGLYHWLKVSTPPSGLSEAEAGIRTENALEEALADAFSAAMVSFLRSCGMHLWVVLRKGTK